MAVPPLDLNARLLHRDALMLVVDKPAGIPVHRGPDNAEARRLGQQGVALDAAFGQLRFGLPRDPALAHRLDRDTSGCLVLGRHRKALELLGKLFKRGEVEKTYWAVVEGGPQADEGRIDRALGRRDAGRGWWMKPDPDGQPASTTWRVLGRGHGPGGAPVTLLAMSPLTGRTHQLRVHAESEGWPILGDPIYGKASMGGPPLHLHAREIVVPLAPGKPPVRAVAPIPAHMRQAVAACGITPAIMDETTGAGAGHGAPVPTASSPVDLQPRAAEPPAAAVPRRPRPPSRW